MTGPGLVVLAALAAGAAVLVWPSRPRREWTPSRRAVMTAGRRGRPGPVAALRGPSATSGAGLVPEALDLIALALLGGGPLAGAVARVGAVLPGACGEELGQVAARLREGQTADLAWRDAGGHWEPARRSLELAEIAGVPPGQALHRAADDLRREAVSEVEVAAARLGVRLVVPLGLAYLPAFVLTTVLPVVLALVRDLSW